MSQRAALVLESDSSSEEESVSSELSLSEFCEIDAEDIDYSSIDYMKAQVEELSDQLAKPQAKYEKSFFRLANLVSFYTGFPDYNSLSNFLQQHFGIRCKRYETVARWKIEGDL